jgi:hypothetical protein
VAIYQRQHSKKSQPLNAGGATKEDKREKAAEAVVTAVLATMQRELFARAQRE